LKAVPNRKTGFGAEAPKALRRRILAVTPFEYASLSPPFEVDTGGHQVTGNGAVSVAFR
jgi:hypothetical protein